MQKIIALGHKVIAQTKEETIPKGSSEVVTTANVHGANNDTSARFVHIIIGSVYFTLEKQKGT